MPDFFTYQIYALIIASILVTLFVLIKWLYYRKFKTDRIKRGDIVHNLSDDAKTKVLKMNSLRALSTKSSIINLPKVYSAEEMQFIDNWYMEEGILQFKQAHGYQFILLKDKPPVPGCKYVSVSGIMVNLKKRDNKTLELIDIQLPKTVKFLMLDEWIK